VKTAVARRGVRLPRVSGITIPQITDAVRPRVIGKDGRAAAQPFLDLHVHGVVIARSIRVARRNDPVVLAKRRVLQIKNPALVRIASRGTLAAAGWILRNWGRPAVHGSAGLRANTG